MVKYNILSILFVILVCWGCGIKSNPVPLSKVSDKIRVVQNLRAFALDDAVTLKWDFLDNDFQKGYIAIDKCEISGTRNGSIGCSGKNNRIARISIKKESIFSFTDKEVQKGKTYKYCLMFCDNFNRCFENDTTEISY